MKRLATICFVLMTALSAGADLRRSDVLLTDSGNLYRVDSVAVSLFNETHPDEAVQTTSSTILSLTIQDESGSSMVAVPGSLTGGINIEPSLAYDPDDDRIYLFWQRKPGPSASELVLVSFKDGVWTSPTTFDNGIWRLRYNLRIRLTHFVTGRDTDGNLQKDRVVIAHAVWWEQHGSFESARYAMINLLGGNVTGLTVRDMTELSSLETRPATRELPENFDKSTFRTPFILDVPRNDSVDVLFADWYTNSYEIVNVRPVLDEKNGVLHIPTGVTTGVMDAPGIRVRDIDNGLMAISAPSRSGGTGLDLLLYSADENTVDYVIYRDSSWSDSKQINLNERFSFGEAVDALRRNINRN